MIISKKNRDSKANKEGKEKWHPNKKREDIQQKMSIFSKKKKKKKKSI